MEVNLGRISYSSATEYNQIVEKTADSFEELKTMNNELEFIKKYLKNQPASICFPLLDNIRSLQKNIETLQLRFLKRKDATGYRSNNGEINEIQWPAFNYTRAYWEPITPK